MLFLGAPLLLGSIYGIIVGIFLSLIFVARIIGEEKMLNLELEGYPDYKDKVKYRLIPYIWYPRPKKILKWKILIETMPLNS